MFNPVGGKKYVLHGPVDDLLCQCASLSSHGTVCTEVRAHFINVSSVFYFCRIHNNVLCTNKRNLKWRWNTRFVGSAGEKTDPGSHIHTHVTLFHIRWVWERLTRCNRRLLWFSPQHLLWWRLLCFSSVKQVGKVGVYRERWEIHSGGVMLQAAQSSFSCVPLQTAFFLFETNYHVSFSYPDFYLCCAGNFTLIIRSV